MRERPCIEVVADFSEALAVALRDDRSRSPVRS
jgi:hypothetical protein